MYGYLTQFFICQKESWAIKVISYNVNCTSLIRVKLKK